MSNGDNFDPKLYGDLFDDDIDPIQMAWIMSTMNDNNHNNHNNDNNDKVDEPDINNTENEKKDEALQPVNLFASQTPSPQSSNPMEQLFQVAPDGNGIMIDEQTLFNNPMLMQMLMSIEPQLLNGEDVSFDNMVVPFLEEPDIEEKIDIEYMKTLTKENEKEIEEEEIKIDKEEIKTEEKNIYVRHKKSNRCNLIECKTKLGLLGFSCRCGYNFCAKHRHTLDHHCTFDHVTRDKNILEKRNEKIVADKIENRI